MKALDQQRLTEALALAETVIGKTDPNPRVGCVIGHADGRVLGRGATQPPGQAHAEVIALRDAAAAGHDTRGATAWVTLEPCAHHGRTPPCCDALIAAGIARVVAAVQDPFPQVAGAGISKLRQAGIVVDLADDTIAQQAWQINIGFFSRVLRGRPWVRVKVAASLDGRTALDNGQSQWITGAAARADGHAWRRRAAAIVTGVGTVLADDPRLDVRWPGTEVQPLRVVLDSGLRTPISARILTPPGQVLMVCADARQERVAALHRTGAEVLVMPAPEGWVDIAALLQELARRDVNEVHVEAGRGLTTSLLKAGLADELLLYLAPRLLGGQQGVVGWPALPDLGASTDFLFQEVTSVGGDLRLRLTPAGSSWSCPPSAAIGRATKTQPDAQAGNA